MPDRPQRQSPPHILASLRSRAWLLVALVAVPLLVDAIVVYARHRAEAVEHLEQDFRHLIGAALAQEGLVVAHTRELLKVLGDEAIDHDAARCASLARRLLRIEHDYRNLGAVLPDGTPLCDGRTLAGPVNHRDQAWFREAVERKDMSRGHYVPILTTSGDGIVFALPVRDGAGTLRAVVHADIGLGWLQRLASVGTLPPAWEALVMAPDGRLVLQQPADPASRSGAPARETLLAALQADSASSLRELSGKQGQAYIYGVAALQSINGDFRLAIGVPKAAVLAEADRDFRNHLLLLALAGIFSALIGWQAIHRSFGVWAGRVHENLRRFGAGERQVRFPENSGIRELREIDGALNRLFETTEAAGAALKETRHDLGLALECAKLATWEWYLPDGVKIGDAHLAGMLGFGDDEAGCDAECWRQRICPGDAPAVQAALQSHLAGAAPLYECEYRLQHRDGHWIWVLERGRVVQHDAAGRPLRLAGTAMEITGRKLTELELRQRTEELVALLDAIPAPVWIARDRACREIVGNRAVNRLYGTSDGTNVSLSVPEIRACQRIRHCRADGVEYASDELPMQRAAAEARPIENFDLRLVAPDGGAVWLFGNAAPLFDDEGRVRGAVAAFVDITRLKTMDEALRRNETVLAQAGKMAHLGAWSLELDETEEFRARSSYWSDEMFRLLGYEPGEVVADAELFKNHIHPDDRCRTRQAAMQAMAAKASYLCEYRIIRNDGAECVFRDHGEFRFDPSGRATHFIGASQDITGRKQAEHELLRHRDQLESLVAERTYELAVAKEAAERASHAKSQFLANISHELRTPLNSLMLLAHVLSDNAWGNLTPQQAEYARMIELSGRDLLHLIDELLDLAKIEAGRLDIQVKLVPFPDIMQNVHRTHRHVARQKGLDFKMEIAADVPAAVQTDPLRLQQLLRNLLSNAIKFTHEGGITLRIRRAVSGWRYGNPALGNADAVIAFDVIDSGIGIPPDQQRQIFEAFEQVQSLSARQYEGTGLGLSIASEIAALLGGELALTSVPGQGSTFTLFLPLAYLGPAKPPAMATPPADAPEVAAAEEVPAPDPLLAGKAVLVVDDDQRNRFALTAMLERQGMQVLGAAGGAEALEMLACDDVDIVLMDIMMPVMDGYQAIRAIRSDLGRTRLPVIALSADAMPETRARCLAAGSSDYLSKPVSNSELLAALRKWLGRPEPHEHPV